VMIDEAIRACIGRYRFVRQVTWKNKKHPSGEER